MSHPAENDCDQCTMYNFTRYDIDAVNPVNWLEMFKNLTPKSLSCPIPPEVLKYLKSDGMMMPQDTHTTAHLNLASATGSSATGENDDDDNVSWASISSDEEHTSVPSEFLQKIRREQKRATSSGGTGHWDRNRGDSPGELYGEVDDEKWEKQSNSSSSSEDDDANGLGPKKIVEVEKFHEYDLLLDSNIKKLGGAVLPKINRKSPKDATWIGFNRSLKCYNVGDIYLLLKTSDVVSQMLENPYKGCSTDDDVPAVHRGASSASAISTAPYLLILKRWDDSWGPEMEFRCFICSNQLIAICQRDLDTCHSSIIKRKDKLLLNIQNFFIQNVQGRFPLEFYVMDIVCHPNGEIYIVDFDVFGMVTDPLLFTYRELQSIYEEMFDEQKGVQKGHSRVGSPCLRFLTESRNFRERKTTNQSLLANDVMTYMRECVTKKF